MIDSVARYLIAISIVASPILGISHSDSNKAIPATVAIMDGNGQIIPIDTNGDGILSDIELGS